MKARITLLLLLVSVACFSQGKFTYAMSVMDNQGKPVSGLLVSFIEETTKKRVARTTDGSGKVNVELGDGEWNMSVGQIRNYKKVSVPPGMSGQGSGMMTYDLKDWERTHRPPVDRSKLPLEIVMQKDIKDTDNDNANAVVKLSIKRADHSPLKKYPVQLTCYALKKSFVTATDNSGLARFLVPKNNEYEVDIDGVESFTYVDVSARTAKAGTEFIYEPTVVKETVKNDTIVQLATANTEGTSARSLVKFAVNCSDCGQLKNEPVYIRDLYSKKVWKTKLDEQGNVQMLLPINRKYMIEFRYQHDADVIDLTDVDGISNYQMSVNYFPDPRLKYPERYLESPEAILTKNFREFIDKQFPPPADGKEVGIYMEWGNQEVNAQSKEALLEVGFCVPENSGPVTLPPANLAFVVDKSGSMASNDRLEKLKKALAKYCAQLGGKDIVSLVGFDHEKYLLMPAQKLTDKSYLMDMIADMRPGGGTMMFDALEEGYKQVQKNFIKGGTNRVILLTDGYDGIPVDSTVKMSSRYNKAGIELSCVGVGSDYNYALLSQLATHGGGLLLFSEDDQDINDVLQKGLNDVLKPCAKDVSVELEYNNKIIFKQLMGFPTTPKGNNRVDIKLDNIYPGLNTLALVKFDLKNPDKDIEKQPVIVRMKYTSYKTKAPVSLEEKAYLKWQPATGQYELVLEKNRKKMYAMAITTTSLKAMADAWQTGNFTGLKKGMEDAMRQLKNLFPKADDADIADLVKKMEDYVKTVSKVIELKKLSKM